MQWHGWRRGRGRGLGTLIHTTRSAHPLGGWFQGIWTWSADRHSIYTGFESQACVPQCSAVQGCQTLRDDGGEGDIRGGYQSVKEGLEEGRGRGVCCSCRALCRVGGGKGWEGQGGATSGSRGAGTGADTPISAPRGRARGCATGTSNSPLCTSRSRCCRGLLSTTLPGCRCSNRGRPRHGASTTSTSSILQLLLLLLLFLSG